MSDIHLTYMCITTPNLQKLKRNLPIVLPHVDSAVIVIGKKCDETVQYLKRFPQVKIIYNPWQDSFRDQYQVGLNHVPSVPGKDLWVNIMDDDEVHSEGMLRSFRDLIEQSQRGERYDVASFRAVDVHEGKVGNPTDYYRQMLYRWNPRLHYQINLHQALVGLQRGIGCNEVYYHYKDQMGSLRGAFRDYWIAGVWSDHKESFEYWYKETGQDPRVNEGAPLVPQPQGLPYPLKDGFRIDSWYELRELVKKHHPEVEYFHDLDEVVKNNHLHSDILAWAVRHNEENDKRLHLHEQHAIYRYLKHLGYYDE